MEDKQGVTPETEPQVETPVEPQEEKKTYTEDELHDMLQRETDKRVNQALEKKQAQWEKDYQKQLEKERSQAEKLAKMSEEERFQEQLKQEREQFENERRQFERERLELQTVKELSAKGLPTEFSDLVIGEDADTTSENIKRFQGQWMSAIEDAVNERLKGKTPSASAHVGAAMSRAEFNKLPYAERQRLMSENPDILDTLN